LLCEEHMAAGNHHTATSAGARVLNKPQYQSPREG
jgi:hypothetical protein